MKKILLCLIFILLTSSVQAVIIEGGDGTGNITAPSDAIGDPGWANVGHGNYSCIYLGNHWVLTCAHCGASNTSSFNGISYNLIAGSTTRLGGLNPIDLIMYRIDASPAGLNDVSISSITPPLGTLVTAIGLGTERGTATAYGWQWDGFLNTKRWGRNLVDSTYSGSINVGYGSNRVFTTMFDKNPTSSLDPNLAFNECQGSSGDSGGAVFYKDANGWQLAGIMEAVSSGAANFGNQTYSIDLSFYKDQILSTLSTCPFSGNIINPEISLGSGALGNLVGNGGFTFTESGNCSVSVNANAYTFVFNTGANTIVETGDFTGSLIKKGTGELILDGNNVFTDVIVSQGTLTTSSIVANSLQLGGPSTIVPEPSSIVLIVMFISFFVLTLNKK